MRDEIQSSNDVSELLATCSSERFGPLSGGVWPEITIFGWKRTANWNVGDSSFDSYSGTVVQSIDAKPLSSEKFSSREEVWSWISSCLGADICVSEEDFVRK